MGERVHVLPFADDGVGLVARLDDVDVPEARPVAVDLLMGVEEILVASRLHLESDRIERGHGARLLICWTEKRSIYLTAV